MQFIHEKINSLCNRLRIQATLLITTYRTNKAQHDATSTCTRPRSETFNATDWVSKQPCLLRLTEPNRHSVTQLVLVHDPHLKHYSYIHKIMIRISFLARS